MPRANELISNDIQGLSLLLKSPFGFGKTIAAASAAVDGETHIAYWDKAKPIELNYFRKIGRPEILDAIQYNVYGSSNANEHLNFLRNESLRPSFKNYVYDSVTMATASFVNWSLGFRNQKDGAKKDPLNSNSIQLIPDFDEYKVETSAISQSLDLYRILASEHGCNIIWTCHPIPSMKIDASGANGKITISKVNNIVSYGSKVASIVPGQFTEIYHFAIEKEWDGRKGDYIEERIVRTKGLGDDFAKTALNLPDQFNITGKLFWEVWKEQVRLSNQIETKEPVNEG
jgi:hypothetical protein